MYFADVNHCESGPCQNGGTCFNRTGPGYSCTCIHGKTGPNCEFGK